jgi:cold shock CspA family protein
MITGAGRIVRWTEDKGFGFIRPDEGSADAFPHVSALPRGLQPSVGMRVRFSAGGDPQGRRPRALPLDARCSCSDSGRDVPTARGAS